MRKFKKLLLCGLMALSMFSLSGCGASLQKFVNSDLTTVVTTRLEQNRQIVSTLLTNKLISNETYKTLNNQLDAQAKVFANNEAGVTTTLCGAIEQIYTIKGHWKNNAWYDSSVDPNARYFDIINDDGKAESVKWNNIYKYVLSDYIAHEYGDWGAGDYKNSSYKNKLWKDGYKKGEGAWERRTSGTTQPIKLIDIANDSNIFDDALNCEIYVLSPDISTSDKSGGIDGAVEAVKDAMDKNSTKLKSVDGLHNYFVKAVDAKGNAITLKDLVDIGSLVTISEDNTKSSENKPGLDLVVKQYGVDILAFRMQEFNQANVDKFLSVLGVDATNGKNTDKWIYYYSGKGDNRVYLMEYPVYMISGLKDSVDNPNMSQAILMKSALSVNILTGNMLVNVETNNVDPVTGEKAKVKALVTNAGDPYLTMAGASNFNAESKSAFVVSGSIKMKLQDEFDSSGKSASVMTGRVILRDYLEATYAPGFDTVDNNSLAIFGRKIRFINMQTLKVNWTDNVQEMDASNTSHTKVGEASNTIILFDKNNPCAKFVDAEGSEVGENSPKLYVQDFCDLTDLRDGKIVRPTAANEVAGTGKGDDDADASAAGLDWTSTTDKVVMTGRFPGKVLGTTDYANDGTVLSAAHTIEDQTIHQTFYVVTTTHDLFTSSLFSSWVNSSSTTASLAWWNNWLSSNKYLYHLDTTNLEAFLYDNFAFELSQSGIVILDLETVAKIQEEFDKDANADANRTVRTISRLLGIFLMFYSIILALAYVADITADLGVKFLEKLTFGHWVAVKYDTDIPTHDQESQQYLTFGRLAIRLIVLIGVGSLLATIDILNLVILLIDTFGGVANAIGEILSGIV